MKKTKLQGLALVLSCCLGASTAFAAPVWSPAPNGNALQGNTTLTLNEDYALTAPYEGNYSLTVNSAGSGNYTLLASNTAAFRQLFTGGVTINNAKVVMNYSPAKYQGQLLNSITVNAAGQLEFSAGGVMGAPGYEGCLPTITLNGGKLINSAIDTGTKAKHNLLGQVNMSNGAQILVKDGLTSSTTWGGNYGLDGNVTVTSGANTITAEKIVLAGRLNTDANANTSTFNIAANSSLTINGYLLNPWLTIDTSSRKLIKTGAGTLALNSAVNAASLSNTYSGGTAIKEGTLRIDGLQAGTGAITVSSGGTLQINSSSTQTNAISIIGAGAKDASNLDQGALYFSKDGANISGEITQAGAATIRVDQGVSATISGVIKGETNTAISKTGAGTLILTADSLYEISGNWYRNGAFNVDEGILKLDGSGRIGVGACPVAVSNGATFYINSSVGDGNPTPTITIAGSGMKDASNNDMGAVYFGQDAVIRSGRLNLSANATVRIDPGKTANLETSIGGAHDLTIVGGGTLSVKADQKVSRNTIVDNGKLVFAVASNNTVVGSNKDSLVIGTITANDNGVIEFATSAVNGYGAAYNPANSPVKLVLNGGTLVNSASQEIGGIGGYAKHNILGLLEFNNGGEITVGAGLKTPDSINSGATWGGNYVLESTIKVTGGTTNAIVADKLVMGTRMAETANTLSVDVVDGAKLTIAGDLLNPINTISTEARSLQKTGAGTLVLSGDNNTYSGKTKVDGGVLKIDGTGNSADTIAFKSAFIVGETADSAKLVLAANPEQTISIPSVDVKENGSIELLMSASETPIWEVVGDLNLWGFEALTLTMAEPPAPGQSYNLLQVDGKFNVAGTEISETDLAKFLSPEMDHYFNLISSGAGNLVLQTDSAAVPEPASWLLLLLGLPLIRTVFRKKERKAQIY